MIAPQVLREVLRRAGLAPSIHNAQPARWRWASPDLWLASDLSVLLPEADPTGAGIALSCGATLEAACLALSAAGWASEITPLWSLDDRATWPGHRMVARLRLIEGCDPDPLHTQLEHRFTWRGAFDPGEAGGDLPYRPDTVMVTTRTDKDWLAALNDSAGLGILRRAAFRRELLGWMRLTPTHPRAGLDGMDLTALRMSPAAARWVGLAFGPLWPLLRATGRTRALTAEAGATVTAAGIALFHRPVGENLVESGRAYLRLWLGAAARGLAGWPMAALTDDGQARAAVAARFDLGPDRALVQAIRFGRPAGPMPPRARRPLAEVLTLPGSDLTGE